MELNNPEPKPIDGSLDDLMTGDLPVEFTERVKQVVGRIKRVDGSVTYPPELAEYLAGYTD